MAISPPRFDLSMRPLRERVPACLERERSPDGSPTEGQSWELGSRDALSRTWLADNHSPYGACSIGFRTSWMHGRFAVRKLHLDDLEGEDDPLFSVPTKEYEKFNLQDDVAPDLFRYMTIKTPSPALVI
ncbi:hypothetical protein EIP91_004075 [Steccherinum ochraceum]|uniref:Uncharacterized protein n=1 Tax=Steccherinum ochraceum TaxID=92696 RepID=A0A4R0R9I0_9APHY|nr:hypothetical protein EIP91_004075 [Steccherinum ochraceum]